MKRGLIALATATTVALGAVVPAGAEETSSPTNYVTGSFSGSSDPATNGWSSSGSTPLDFAIAIGVIAGIVGLVDAYLKGRFDSLPEQLQEIRENLPF